MLKHDYGIGEGVGLMMTYKQISFFYKVIVLKQKTTNNFMLYIFVISIASIHFHDFLLDLSPVLLKLIICFFNLYCFIILC